MGKRRFALGPGRPKELLLRWRWRLRDFEVSLGNERWQLERAAVLAGATITLPGGSSLLVRWAKRRFWSVAMRDELWVELDGVPVPGSDSHPRSIGRRAGNVIVFFGLLRVVFGGLWHLFEREESVASAFDLIALAGLVLIALGIAAWLGRRLPVALAAGLFALELIYSLILAGRLNGGGVVIGLLIIAHLVRAWRRMKPRPKLPTLASVFE